MLQSDRIEKIMEKPEILLLMELLRKFNTETYHHSYRVAVLTEKLLDADNEKTIPKEIHEEIITGALLHDIGKALLPFNLCQMSSSLDKNEYDIVKMHTIVSLEIVKPVFSDIVKNICHLHHERINGTGYLQGCGMSDIEDYVLLVQIADVYEALTSSRAYKEKYTADEAIKIMDKETKKLLLDDYYLSLLMTLEGEK